MLGIYIGGMAFFFMLFYIAESQEDKAISLRLRNSILASIVWPATLFWMFVKNIK